MSSLPKKREPADKLLKVLGGADREQALRAAYLLGGRFEGSGAAAASVTPETERVLAGLEAVAAAPKTGAWLRKRCRRAIRKVRAGAGEVPEVARAAVGEDPAPPEGFSAD